MEFPTTSRRKRAKRLTVQADGPDGRVRRVLAGRRAVLDAAVVVGEQDVGHRGERGEARGLPELPAEVAGLDEVRRRTRRSPRRRGQEPGPRHRRPHGDRAPSALRSASTTDLLVPAAHGLGHPGACPSLINLRPPRSTPGVRPATVRRMRVGIFSSAITTGTVDDVVAERRSWVRRIRLVLGLADLQPWRARLSPWPAAGSRDSSSPDRAHLPASSDGDGAAGAHVAGLWRAVVPGYRPLPSDRHRGDVRAVVRQAGAPPAQYLSVLLPLLRGEAVDVDDGHYRVRGALSVAGATPPASRSRHWVPRCARLAGSMTDGTVTWCVGPNTLRDLTVPTLRDAAEAAGRLLRRG